MNKDLGQVSHNGPGKRFRAPVSTSRWKTALFSAIAAVIVVAAGLVWMLPRSDNATLRVGQAAPDFTLPNALGGEVRLADYVGKQPVLIYFSMGHG